MSNFHHFRRDDHLNGYVGIVDSLYEGKGDYRGIIRSSMYLQILQWGFFRVFEIGFYGFCNWDFVFVFYNLLIPV